MRKCAALFAGILVCGSLAVILSAPVFGSPESVTGQLVDLTCYSMDKSNTGNAHKGKGLVCAQACAKEGFAVGIVTAEGKVYRVAGDLAANKNAKLVPHMTHTVTVSGDVSEKDGQMTISGTELTMKMP